MIFQLPNYKYKNIVISFHIFPTSPTFMQPPGRKHFQCFVLNPLTKSEYNYYHFGILENSAPFK